MSCDRYLTAITDYALGAELTADAAGHLRACAACRARLEDQRRRIARVTDDLRDLLAVVPSPDFCRKVRARIDLHPNRRAAAPAWWLSAAAAAAIVIAIVIGAQPERAGRDVHLQPDDRRASVARAPDGRAPGPLATPVAVDRQRDPAPVRPSPPPRLAATRTTPPVQRPAAPEVLVPPDQALAIARLIELVNQGALADVDLPADRVTAALTEDLAPAPLTVAPITVPDVEIVSNQAGSGPGQR